MSTSGAEKEGRRWCSHVGRLYVQGVLKQRASTKSEAAWNGRERSRWVPDFRNRAARILVVATL